MASLNRCEFIGHLGRDPELRYTTSGTAVANFSIACNESWKDKETGEKQERTEWIRLQAWGRLAEIAGEYLKKGAQVYVAGRMQTRQYEKDGEQRYITEVVMTELKMLGSREGGGGYQPKDEDAPPEARRSTSRPSASQGQQSQPDGDLPFDDDIPFAWAIALPIGSLMAALSSFAGGIPGA